MQPTYAPAALVAICGAALIMFGVLADSDAATVGGIIFGGVVAGLGAMLAGETFARRRDSRRSLGKVGPRTIEQLTRNLPDDPPPDPTHDPGVVIHPLTRRQLDDIAEHGWTPDDPRDPYR